MRKSFFLAALTVAAACAETSTVPQVYQDDIVPAREIAAIWQQLPYECVEYRASTESCEVLVRNTQRGLQFLAEGQGAVSANPALTFNIRLSSRIRGNAFCANSRDLEVAIGDADPGLTRELTETLRAEYARFGEICTTYYRSDGDDFVSLSRDERGQLIPDGSSASRFFAAPKALRF